jgi:hypothetical protein
VSTSLDFRLGRLFSPIYCSFFDDFSTHMSDLLLSFLQAFYSNAHQILLLCATRSAIEAIKLDVPPRLTVRGTCLSSKSLWHARFLHFCSLPSSILFRILAICIRLKLSPPSNLKIGLKLVGFHVFPVRAPFISFIGITLAYIT